MLEQIFQRVHKRLRAVLVFTLINLLRLLNFYLQLEKIKINALKDL